MANRSAIPTQREACVGAVLWLFGMLGLPLLVVAFAFRNPNALLDGGGRSVKVNQVRYRWLWATMPPNVQLGASLEAKVSYYDTRLRIQAR
jgi:hypothetical protein